MKKTITEMFFDLPKSRDYIERLAEGEKPENLSTDPAEENPVEEKTAEEKTAEENPENSENSQISQLSQNSHNSENSQTEEEVTDETDEFMSNINESLQLMRGFAAGRGLSADQLDSILLSLFRLTRDTARGILTIENVEKLLKALSYDRDLTNARYEGEIAGRNARIEIEMRQTTDSDGVPRMSGKSTSGASALPGSIFDLVRSARE